MTDMNSETQLDYTKRQIDHEIELYTQRKHFNRRAALAFTIIPAALAALATILIGAFEKIDNKWLPIFAMIATGIASVLGAWEALFSNRKLWRVNNAALSDLYELKADIEYREKDATRALTQAETDQYFDRLKVIRNQGEQSYLRAVGND